MEAATSDITLKLVIDAKANKVLFAEASKDFVDFLLFLLTLPIVTVIKLLANDSQLAFGNLYNTFKNLDQAYLQPKIERETLLYHVTSTSVANASLLLGTSVTPTYVFYKKYYCSKLCMGSGSEDKQVKCSKCGDLVTKSNAYFACPNTTEFDGNGYVQGLVPYMIYDDLSVVPMSTASSILFMNELNVSHADVKEVKVGKKEALELLKFSLQSKSVLTQVFLGEKKSTELDFQEKSEVLVGEQKSAEMEFQEKLDRYMKEMKQ